MAKSRQTKIETIPLPEFQRGKINYARGNYYLTVGRKKLEIFVGTTISAQDAQSLVGQDVYAAVSGKNIVAIARIPKWIICYIPAPDFLRRIRPEVQIQVINKMASEKIITPAMKDELIRGL